MKMFFLYYTIFCLIASLINAENVNEFSLKESICQQIAIDNKLARENVNFIGNKLVVNSKQSPVDLHCIASDREIRMFKYKGPTFLIRDVIAPESKIVFLSIPTFLTQNREKISFFTIFLFACLHIT
jgi:hypothetical protein